MAKTAAVGDPAPSFDATLQSGECVRLSDYRGKYLVLYFYPRAFTPGCTAEVCSFRDNQAELRALGAEIVGVSIDPPEKAARFGEKYSAGFPLIGDADGAISRAYGVVWPLLSTARRETFVIDPEGKVAARFHHELLVGRHQDDVLAFLKARAGR
jgi:peroxiredoxin Q/BCP